MSKEHQIHGGTQMLCSQLRLMHYSHRVNSFCSSQKILIISCHASFELLRSTWNYECKIAKETAFYVHLFGGSSLSLKNIHSDDLFSYKVAEMH